MYFLVSAQTFHIRKMSENLYNNINKFMNMQETMLNQST